MTLTSYFPSRLAHRAMRLLCVGSLALAASTGAIAADLYKSPIPENLNVRFVENHIEVDRPAASVFAWVTTWGNLVKWLPVALGVHGADGVDIARPSRLGERLIEDIDGHRSVQYSVVTLVDGTIWTVAGQMLVDGKAIGPVQFVATFTVTPMGPDKAVFTRVFQMISPSGSPLTSRHPVEDPVLMQHGLDRLKSAIEGQDSAAR